MTATSIMLASGALFDIAEPETTPVSLNDIAYGLARVCRFAGHTNRYYSVAEHCTHVARLVDMDLARAALLHDAAEALIGDVTSPLKALLPDYRAIEQRIERALYDQFGLLDHYKHPDIKRADITMAALEAKHMMPWRPIYWDGLFAAADPVLTEMADKRCRFQCDSPAFAEAAWLRAWHRYSHADAQRGQGGAA